jgi:L-aminopeptidase/D-esterase-like protein
MSDIAGLRIGHADDQAARTGCTVLLGPFRGASHIAGHATGSREIDSLSTLHLVPRIDALLLTGGSAFGLAAAEGVVAWLEERGLGFETPAARVPIVPAAVIFDLGVGRADRRPDAAMGRAACDAARPGLPAVGRVGAGTGATVGKVLGPAHATPGGFGYALERQAGHAVLAVAVVNPIGDVIGDDGRILAGARAADGTWADSRRIVRGDRGAGPPPVPGTNTTLAAVVTDAPLPRDALAMIARMGAAALARRITPVFTPFDGDLVFALSTTPEPEPVGPGELLAFGVAACDAIERAIVNAVMADGPGRPNE